MLAVFEVDEYAQYPHVLRMLTAGETVYQSIRNFSVYLHYFYGYPFYFFSALALIPLKWIIGSGWESGTPLIMLVLRQVINILPVLVSLLLWVWMQTRFRPWWKALGLFLLLLMVPVLVLNNLWWHPDSLVFLFITGTIFFLVRDDLRFGRNFIFAAVSCGLATGTKHLGLFFVLAIPVYILYGLAARRIRVRKALAMATLFMAVMAASVVISNPLLLLPIERAEIIAVQKLQFQQTSVGILTSNTETFFSSGYPDDLRIHYGTPLFILLAIISLLAGIWNKERRLLSILILTWMIPLTVVILNFGTRRTHYFFPVMIPLFTSLVNILSGEKLFSETITRLPRIVLKAGAALAVLLITVQAYLYLRTDIEIYRRTLFREVESNSIRFNKSVENQVMARIPEEPIKVYRDWRVYFPETPTRHVEMNWNMATYDYIREYQPDLILLERENILLFGQPEVVANAVDPDRMAMIHEFYAAAEDGLIDGYRFSYGDSFGMVFIEEGLYDTYFKKH